MLDLQSNGREFDFQSECHQVVTTKVSNCLQGSKPTWYITNTKVNSAFHPSEVNKLSTSMPGWGQAGARLTLLCGR